MHIAFPSLGPGGWPPVATTHEGSCFKHVDCWCSLQSYNHYIVIIRYLYGIYSIMMYDDVSVLNQKVGSGISKVIKFFERNTHQFFLIVRLLPSRLLPQGRGKMNLKAFDFYNSLLQECSGSSMRGIMTYLQYLLYIKYALHRFAIEYCTTITFANLATAWYTSCYFKPVSMPRSV